MQKSPTAPISETEQLKNTIKLQWDDLREAREALTQLSKALEDATQKLNKHEATIKDLEKKEHDLRKRLMTRGL